MKNSILLFAMAAFVSVTPSINATVTIAHVENAVVGQFLDSAGSSIPSGGVSIGFFNSAPADSAFGTTINNWTDLWNAGFMDVRSISGATLSSVDWDFPLAIGGSVINIPIGLLPAGTQLYVAAFDAGTYDIGNPQFSFPSATQWAVVKDNANLSPADLGTKSVLLNTAIGATEVLRGTDNGVNVNMTAIVPVPEPSMVGFVIATAGAAMLPRRRRTGKQS